LDTLHHILNGFTVCLQPINLAYTFIGVLLGTIIGILPGIGPAATIALLIPITYGMEPLSALIMMSGVFYGARYGGSMTAILIRTPGEAASVMTALDGYEMARKGRAGAALAIAAIGSFIAGTAGIVALTFLAVPLASLAVRFGPAEYFGLALVALSSVAMFAGSSPAKGLIATVLGLMIATIGIDIQSGQSRFTLGIPEFFDGIDLVVIVVGLFALPEVFRGIEQTMAGTAPPVSRITGKLWLTREEWFRSRGPIWRGTIIGFIIGVLPGAGGTISAILSYGLEKKLSKHPEEFGHGAIEGVAAPEAANNSDTAGAMVPMLTLGVPGGSSTAVLMTAFILYGIQPGPLLFEKRPELVWGLIDSMYIGNIMLLILNLPLIGLFVRLLYIPGALLYPMIVSIAVIGVYATNASSLDLYLLLFFGVVGYVFDKLEIPLAPLVLGLVLGDMLEETFRQAMTISGGSVLIFFRSPIASVLLTTAVIVAAFPYFMRVIRIRSGEPVARGSGDAP
jgi:putative tricarboxylic transport membrane protein